MAGVSHIISSLQYKQVQPIGNLANCLFLIFKTERKNIWKFVSIKERQKSKSAHISWGEDRKGCQVVILSMLAGERIEKGVKSAHVSWGWDRTGCQVVNLPHVSCGWGRTGCQIVNLPMLAGWG